MLLAAHQFWQSNLGYNGEEGHFAATISAWCALMRVWIRATRMGLVESSGQLKLLLTIHCIDLSGICDSTLCIWAFNGGSALQRFNVIQICNGLMFDFYPGLPHIIMRKWTWPNQKGYSGVWANMVWLSYVMCLGIPDPHIVCGSRTETVLTIELAPA